MMRRSLLAAGAASLILAAAGSVNAWAETNAERIVVAGGDLTEIVFALGAGDRLAGVDSTSTYPKAATALPQIGYLRRLSAEGVLSLAPDLLLADPDIGPDAVIEQIRSAGVPLEVAPAGDGPDAVIDKIAFVGAALGREEDAAALADDYAARLQAARTAVSALDGSPKVLFVLTVQNGAPLVAGAQTSADAMIRAAGGENAVVGFEGFKPMSRESLIAAQPDVVLMMAQHAERAGGLDAVLARPDVAATPAGRDGRGVMMDGMLLLGFGPRTPEAIEELARRIRGLAAPQEKASVD